MWKNLLSAEYCVGNANTKGCVVFNESMKVKKSGAAGHMTL